MAEAHSLLGLAEAWEGEKEIRNRLQTQGVLTLWPRPEVTGLPSLAAAALNYAPLKHLIKHWCPQHPVGSLPNGRVSPPLGVIETEELVFAKNM